MSKLKVFVVATATLAVGVAVFWIYDLAGLDWHRQIENRYLAQSQTQMLSDGTKVRIILWQKHTPGYGVPLGWQSVPLEDIFRLMDRGMKLDKKKSYLIPGYEKRGLVEFASGGVSSRTLPLGTVKTYRLQFDAAGNPVTHIIPGHWPPDRNTYRVLVEKHAIHGWYAKEQRLVSPEHAATRPVHVRDTL